MIERQKEQIRDLLMAIERALVELRALRIAREIQLKARGARR